MSVCPSGSLAVTVKVRRCPSATVCGGIGAITGGRSLLPTTMVTLPLTGGCDASAAEKLAV